MQKSGGAVTHMQQSLINLEEMEALDDIIFLVGSAEIINKMPFIQSRIPFDDDVMSFLNEVSKEIMSIKETRQYADVVTLAFWLRKASLMKLKERFHKQSSNLHLGKGLAFHIAPSNVPVNYAYSLVTGLLMGNVNIVRVPSKDFPQVRLINRAINKCLDKHERVRQYVCLIRYERSSKLNDLLSSIADIRIVWGGDATIAELRKSPLKPRASEITFADRYSLAVIDSDKYLELENKDRIAEDFYNDTYLTDQNACTSPRMVIWMGEQKKKAKDIFWAELHKVISKKYEYRTIQGVNKLTSSYLLAVMNEGVKIENTIDNLIVRVNIPNVSANLMDLKDNSGFFMEYDCDNIMELRNLCDDARCQTIGYIGNSNVFMPLLESGIKGVDRIVPIGNTMDFDLIWDGYNLYDRMTREIVIDAM
ncbi:acyl-CoA reductase [Lacrimispora saccharolytica]|uniref:acyl-CoA reductase n=1 Tax=Lacrimispora saccharolytica TaxID=84030 RepID=UPI00265CD9DF|nr:acyl-CoA reductase [Lacrimispora saccharolytica]MCF2656980.1 hypothetical protein [Lacrimispora saccharolytica]